MKPNILLVLVVSILHACNSLREYEYDYLGSDDPELTEVSELIYDDNYSALEEQNESNEPSKYDSDDALPYDNLEQMDTITIEQFVNELKRRKKAKEQKTQNKRKAILNEPHINKSNKKGNTRSAQNKTRSSKPSNTKSNKKTFERKQKRKSSENRSNQKPRKASIQKQKKRTPTKTQKKHEQTPSKKNKVKTKPSRKQKPFNKPKEDKDDDKEDFFQIGNSDSNHHSDHHIHQHDHLEAHKHHHKHKASHSHAHDHSNDHEHNHKHTHNHIHNHVHKHNEAHEHTAEHAHTEKHHHKHLEYIDAGGWRRRKDEYSETMLEEEPVALIMENRGLKNPKVKVKSYLENIIAFYKDAANTIDNENQENGLKGKHLYNSNINDYDVNNDKIDQKDFGPEEYRDYSLGNGVQFANEYDADEYYEDQTRYESTKKLISIPILDWKTNNWIGINETRVVL